MRPLGLRWRVRLWFGVFAENSAKGVKLLHPRSSWEGPQACSSPRRFSRYRFRLSEPQVTSVSPLCWDLSWGCGGSFGLLFFVLLLQAIFFAHGGLTTLGVNTLTLGLLGPATAAGLWRLLGWLGAHHALGLAIACGVGSMAVYVADALVLSLALADVADPAVTLTGVLVGFAPVQIPLAVLESAVSAGIVRMLAMRRPSLLPTPMRSLGRASQAAVSVSVILLAFGLSGCAYEGIDGTVFGATAEAAGRPPTDSLLDLSQGEFGLGMSIIILFGLGFIAGRSWERLMNSPQTSEGDDALSR